MMAGNVTVAVVDGVLRIQGDAESNHVTIQQLRQTFEGQWPGVRLRITGQNLQDNVTTTINGGTSAIIVEGVKAGTQIRLGAGDDGLRIVNISGDSVPDAPQVVLPGRISISSDAGADDLRLYMKNGDRVFINSGADADYVQLTASTVRHLTLNADPIRPAGASAVGTGDRVLIRQLKSRGDVKVTSGIGVDDVDINGSCRFDGSLLVDSGAGDDLVDLVGASATSPLNLNGGTTLLGGSGHDTLRLDAVAINGSLFGDLGDGADLLIGQWLTSAVVLTIDYGPGADRTYFAGVDVLGVDLDGGTGFDELQRGWNANLGDETIVNFESDVRRESARQSRARLSL